MITLALDTATARLTLAVSDGDRVASRSLEGPRRHAAQVLALADSALTELGARVGDVGAVLTGDGPGSFTGLRVSAAVAKALTWQRPQVMWRTAPSLMIRAAAHAPRGGGTVLALADALRGELYAGAWRFKPGCVVQLTTPLRALSPEALGDVGTVDVVIGSIPERLVEQVRLATGREPVRDERALPEATWLLRLDQLDGGTSPVADPAAWQPEYGRPAEAQAVWERKHGRPLPDSTHHAR